MAVINKKSIADPQDICRLAVGLGVSNATAAVLINRGINSEEIGRQFLDCDDSCVNDPFEMLGMYEAVALIDEAIEEQKRITIYGDYDVDGITSVCILYKYLKSIGARVNCYIPNRFTEGYGLNTDAIAKIASKGTDIIISIDCGITSVTEVALAKELGMDFMIVDHHNPPKDLPDADVILNPKQIDCPYPFKELCSAGLATKIVEAHGGKDAAAQFYDVAAIGTVADVVPLLNENRYYVKKGIEKINNSPCFGVKALKAVAGYQDKAISARGIAFGLAPRLNAAGRMSSAKDGLNMFLAEDFKSAFDIAVKLNEYNDERRKIEQEIYTTGMDASVIGNMCNKKVNVVCGNGWNKGVIGIAASRFVEQYHRPTVVISCAEDVCTASARSIPGFDIYLALCECKDLFTKFGGHSQAAGFSLPMSNIPEFIKRFEEYADAHVTEEMLIPAIDCEIKLSPADIDTRLAKELSLLEPFGKDNEPPLFWADMLEFKNAVVIGKEKNVLKASVNAGGATIDCVGFGKADYINVAGCSAPKSAVFSVDLNHWQGVEKVQLALKDVKVTVKAQSDIDAVINAMESRLFEAFESGFVVDTPICDAHVSVEDMFEAVKEHRMGSLIIVNDRETLNKLLSLVVINGFGSDIDIHIGTLPKNHEFGANTILAMPYDDCIPAGEFARVYVSKYTNVEKLKEIKNYTVYEASSPYSIITKRDRNSFAAMYRALHELAPKLYQWGTLQGVIDAVTSIVGEAVSVFDLKIVLGVFKQLEFLTFESADGMIKVSFSDKIVKRQLTQSELFNRYCELTVQ